MRTNSCRLDHKIYSASVYLNYNDLIIEIIIAHRLGSIFSIFFFFLNLALCVLCVRFIIFQSFLLSLLVGLLFFL